MRTLERGYLEVKTPLLYDEQTYETSGHLQNYEENIFWVHSHAESDRRMALKPMNCPGHMLLFGERLRSYKDLPMRFAESSTLHRDELGGTLHGLLRVKHITQDDAHLFCSPDQIEDEIFGCLDYGAYLYDLFGMEAKFELSTRPEKKLGTRRGVGLHRGCAEGGTGAARDRVLRQRGRRRFLRAEDRPAHARRARPLVADGHRSSSTLRCRSGSASRTWAPTTRSTTPT